MSGLAMQNPSIPEATKKRIRIEKPAVHGLRQDIALAVPSSKNRLSLLFKAVLFLTILFSVLALVLVFKAQLGGGG